MTLAEEDMYACTEVEDNNDDTLLKQYNPHCILYLDQREPAWHVIITQFIRVYSMYSICNVIIFTLIRMEKEAAAFVTKILSFMTSLIIIWRYIYMYSTVL